MWPKFTAWSLPREPYTAEEIHGAHKRHPPQAVSHETECVCVCVVKGTLTKLINNKLLHFGVVLSHPVVVVVNVKPNDNQFDPLAKIYFLICFGGFLYTV